MTGGSGSGAAATPDRANPVVNAYELVGNGESEEGMRAIREGHTIQAGCGEIWAKRPVEGDGPPETRLKIAIVRSIQKDVDLRVDAVVRREGGGWVVNLSGQPKFAGMCAVPRLKFPVEQAAQQLGPVSIELNGSAKDWRCLGDETGEGECWQQSPAPAPRGSGGQK